MKLTHEAPQSQGAANAIKRAKQLVSMTYAPKKPLPILNKIFNDDGTPQYYRSYAVPGFPLKGIVYSSVRCVEKIVGYNISPETYITALSNPNSVIYNRRIVRDKQGVHAYYGIVCSCFLSYVLQLPYKQRCAGFLRDPAMQKLTISDFDELRLCDAIMDPKHVAIITDIERDENGKVQYISVSESCMPFSRETRFSREGFKAYWLDDPLHDYGFYRYARLDDITYTPTPFAPLEGESADGANINRTLMPDFGNKANYTLGKDPVELSVFDPAFDTVAVTDPDGKTENYPVRDGKVILQPEKTGFYTACCVRGEEKSDAVEWCVTELSFTTDKASYRPGETVKIRYSNPAGDPLVGWQYIRVDNEAWTESGYFFDMGSEGEFTVPMTEVPADTELFLAARNAYGCYVSARIPVKRED